MSTPETENEPGHDGVGDAPMRAAIMSVFFCGLSFAVLALAFVGARAGLGVALGGLIATANLWVFARVGQAFVAQKGHAAPWGVIAVLKMVLLFGGIWLLMKSGLVPWLSLAAGYAALPFGITIASFFGPRPPETDAQPGADVIKARPRAPRKPTGER
jgi:hypothetical protein